MATHPKWKYHRELKPMIVHDPEAEESLGDEWVDHPDQLLEAPAGEEPETDAAETGDAPDAPKKPRKSKAPKEAA